MNKPRRFRTLNNQNFLTRLPELFIKHPSLDQGMDGHMFETFDADRDAVLKVHAEHPNRVATVVHVDSGAWYITRGFHYVNRVGYLLAKEDLPEFKDFRY